jgi:hypothetical protein
VYFAFLFQWKKNGRAAYHCSSHGTITRMSNINIGHILPNLNVSVGYNLLQNRPLHSNDVDFWTIFLQYIK